ncbi:MAG: trigger factor [Candidatus Yanofskybacteria bacterium RIFCSPLOWO2_01_FULL_49_17]|uniref:Trigger factor n=1 Tax=Candidatus Yanofskybacteria bacterium RIFCSPLOWO2_01_FULL_49_17 TaxID=1802700 RepID=A0A1F8GTJ4_9BACT|nr:MAG: trigger factor [Candidatus Yanofskybacteria bacterium RIFCSPLOWO2_01_FULL_49_17]
MTFTIKEKDSQNRVLTVELNREDLGRYEREAEHALGSDLKIDGFRKGKVPNDVVRKQLGEAAVREAALQTAMQRSLNQILAREGLDVVEASDLSVKENTAEKLVYSVNLRLFPTVVLPPLDTIKIERRPVGVEPKELDDALESIRASRADVINTDRPAAAGNRVEVDFEVHDGGQIIDGGTSQNHPLVIGKNNFVPGFEEQLIGMKKDETKEFSLTAPADFANKEVAGKKLNMKVTMRLVQEVKLPKLDDAFARRAGKFENIDQLILSIKEGLLREKEEKESQRVRLAAMDKLVAGAKCDISEQMVSDQLDSMTQSFDQDLHRRNMELGLYLAKVGKTQEDLRKEWRENAKKQVSMSLSLHALAHEKDIKVAPEEVDAALEALVKSAVAGTPDGTIPSDLDLDVLRRDLESRLLTEKTLQYLEHICVS